MAGLLTLLGFLLAAPSAEPPPIIGEPEERSIVTAWVEPENCNLRIARQVELRDFLADSVAWHSECVAVTGFWRERALFLSSADARRKGASYGDKLQGRRVGLYAHRDVWAEEPRHARLFTMVGIVKFCDSNAFLGGYCHSVTEGPVILIAEAHEGRRSATDRLRPAR